VEAKRVTRAILILYPDASPEILVCNLAISVASDVFVAWRRSVFVVVAMDSEIALFHSIDDG
jgi:hypothetical protein